MTISIEPQVNIIVLCWNQINDTLECIESIERLSYKNLKTIIIDNGSSDGTYETVRTYFPHIEVIRCETNIGYSEGNNIGIKRSIEDNVDFIFILNNDTVAFPDSLSLMVKILEEDNNIGMLCPMVVSYHHPKYQYLGGKIHWNIGAGEEIMLRNEIPNQNIDVDYAPGCAVLIKSEVIKKIGLLDPAYFAYFEDVDLSIRCLNSGYRILAVPVAIINHKGTLDNVNSKLPIADHLQWRNRMLFMRKYGKLIYWPSFLKAYIRKSLERYYDMMSQGRVENAEAVIDGVWSGIMGHTGHPSSRAPIWLKKSIRNHKKQWLWVTGWLYFWDYHNIKT